MYIKKTQYIDPLTKLVGADHFSIQPESTFFERNFHNLTELFHGFRYYQTQAKQLSYTLRQQLPSLKQNE